MVIMPMYFIRPPFMHGSFLWCSGTAMASFRKPGKQPQMDGKDFKNIFLRRGFGVYVLDQPRRGNAGRSTRGKHH